jgi:hypothetical protein
MGLEKNFWKDDVTPLSADNLNAMTNQIVDNRDNIVVLESGKQDKIEGTPNKIACFDRDGEITSSEISIDKVVTDAILSEELENKANKDVINELSTELEGKQDKLTAGDGISIEGNKISATNSGGGGSIDTSNLQEKFAEVSKFSTLTQLTMDTGLAIKIDNPNAGWKFGTSDGHQLSANPEDSSIRISYRADPARFAGVATPTDNHDAANKAYVDEKPGQKTAEGGEIFNDYENNIAGSKCFQIIELIDKKTIKLDSVDGLQNGQTISIVLNANYDFYTTIANVKPNNTTIILTQELPTEWGTTMSSDNEKNKLWVPDNPSLGTHYLGRYTHTEGINNIVSNTAGHSEGGDNITGGKFGHTEGRRNKAGYAAHAQNQDNQALGNFSSAGGQGNIATELAQDVIGRYNKVNKNAIAIVGNGTSDTDRNNAFEVLKDGSATIDVQGYSANSVIRKDYVDSYFTTMCSANIEPNKENVLYGTMGDSLITDLSYESSSGKLIISDTYNLICIDISKFTSNFQDNNGNSYPAISGGGLTLYYKDNKLYLNGTYTAASHKSFSDIGTINFIGGMKYTAQVYDKTVKGVGITVNGNNITSGALNVTMSQINTSGVVSASCDISVDTVGTLTLNVSKDIKFVNQEVKFMLSVGQNRDFVPFNKNQIIDLSKPYDNTITTYQNTTYIYSSAPCYFNYMMYTYDIIKRDYATKEYVDNRTPKIIVSDSEPTDKVEGMIWIKPINN